MEFNKEWKDEYLFPRIGRSFSKVRGELIQAVLAQGGDEAFIDKHSK